MQDKRLDVICLGRSSVDLYGEQVGGYLEDMQSFAKYVGGCPANISIGASRLGLKSALITRVGNEQMGRFIRQTLITEGVDASHVTTDPARLTALVILGIRDRKSSPHIFYRENCADMGLRAEHIDPNFIQSAKALVLTGTHFSAPGVEEASRAAIRYAKAGGVKVALDIDYRPVAWGLTDHGDGENRFVESTAVSAHLQTIAPDCDLIVGTEEEIHIAGGATDTISALKTLRGVSDAVFVVKRGPLGCVVIPGGIPDDLDDGVSVEGREVEVYNTLGAGDGFMSGFLRGWVPGESWETCCQYGNAAGALVVSRHGCAPAIPSWEEMQDYLEKGSRHFRLRDDERLAHIHRVTTQRQHLGDVCAIAFDHRSQFEEIAERHGKSFDEISRFKKLIAEGARTASEGANGTHRSAAGAAPVLGALIDETYGFDILADLAGGVWWLARPVELPGSRPLEFEFGDNIAAHMREWPVNHVAKCLIRYTGDDPSDLKQRQLRTVSHLYQACISTGHELLLEVIPPDSTSDGDAAVIDAMGEFYAAGVRPDWWKLPPPLQSAGWGKLNAVIQKYDSHCRGILMLGLNAPMDDLMRDLQTASEYPVCKGFAVGRSLFQTAAEEWFAGNLSDAAAIADISRNYQRLLKHWSACRSSSQAA
jgi:5-dehydro-2-deoxygluconokinase